MYLGVAGATAKQKKKRLAGGGGGGVTPAITIATAATGNHNNAVKFAIYNSVSGDFDGASQGTTTIYDGTGATLGTASSPTRTTQSFDIAANDLRNGAYYNGTGSLQAAEATFVIGGYIRHNGSSASSFEFEVQQTIVSRSTTNSVLMTLRNNNNFNQNQDTTSFSTSSGSAAGSHDLTSFPQTGNHFMPVLFLTGKGGATPQAGDSFTVRIAARANVDGTTCTATHDLTINLT
jgi:hypothetical protein